MAPTATPQAQARDRMKQEQHNPWKFFRWSWEKHWKNPHNHRDEEKNLRPRPGHRRRQPSILQPPTLDDTTGVDVPGWTPKFPKNPQVVEFCPWKNETSSSVTPRWLTSSLQLWSTANESRRILILRAAVPLESWYMVTIIIGVDGKIQHKEIINQTSPQLQPQDQIRSPSSAYNVITSHKSAIFPGQFHRFQAPLELQPLLAQLGVQAHWRLKRVGTSRGCTEIHGNGESQVYVCLCIQ